MVNNPSQRRHHWTGVAAGLLCLAGLAPARAQTPAAPEATLVVGRGQATRLLINRVDPAYPPLAKVNYIEGQVNIEMLVSDQGRVAWAHVLQGNPILAAAALRAVRRWLYRPLVTARGPVAFLTTVKLNFTLRGTKADQRPLNPERDLTRQVNPPAVLSRVVDPGCTSFVHMRVLVNDEGQVIDSQPLQGPPSQFEGARRAVEQWTFGAARWGSMHLPWYLDVDVPVADPTVRSAAADPNGS